MTGGSLASYRSSSQPGRQPCRISILLPAFTLVMLVWGVASEALREIITGFLDEVRFE